MHTYARAHESGGGSGFSQSILPATRVNPANKIVVTTTISSEEGAGLSSPDAFTSISSGTMPPLQQMAADGKIVMLRVGPRTFLGLTNNRRHVSPLQIDDHLFIFTPRENPLIHLADLIAELIRSLPADTPVPQVRARIEEIATALHHA